MAAPVPAVELQASASANLEAQARGTDTGTLILCGTGTVLFLACGYFLKDPTAPLILRIFGVVGALGGLAMIVLGGVNTFSSRRARNKVESPLTEIALGAGTDQAFVRTAHIETPGDIVRVIRSLVRERKALPAPHGRVVETRGPEFKLEPYSEGDKAAYSAALAEREKEHDAKALELLRLAAGSASAARLQDAPASAKRDSTTVTVGPIDIDPDPPKKG
jgi:hypothetical protein